MGTPSQLWWPKFIPPPKGSENANSYQPCGCEPRAPSFSQDFAKGDSSIWSLPLFLFLCFECFVHFDLSCFGPFPFLPLPLSLVTKSISFSCCLRLGVFRFVLVLFRCPRERGGTAGRLLGEIPTLQRYAMHLEYFSHTHTESKAHIGLSGGCCLLSFSVFVEFLGSRNSGPRLPFLYLCNG